MTFGLVSTDIYYSYVVDYETKHPAFCLPRRETSTADTKARADGEAGQAKPATMKVSATGRRQ